MGHSVSTVGVKTGSISYMLSRQYEQGSNNIYGGGGAHPPEYSNMLKMFPQYIVLIQNINIINNII